MSTEVDLVEVERAADELAAEYDLNAGRVRLALYRLLDAGMVTRCYPLCNSLADALALLPPRDALRLFEEEDLGRLVRREIVVDYLFHDFTPLHTRAELTHLAEDFTVHLEQNREHLLLSGYPRTHFWRSEFLAWHLGHLCFTKLPVDTRPARDPKEVKAKRNSHDARRDGPGGRAYRYSWVREPAERPWNSHNAATDRHPIEPPSYAVAMLRGPLHDCCYEEAALVPGLTQNDAARLAGLRPKLLELRIGVLRALAKAARGQEAPDIGREFFGLMAGALSRDDARFLLAVDEFQRELRGPTPWWRGLPMVPHHGGLTDLLDVVGHFASEVAIGALHWTALKLRAAIGDMRLASYYEAVASPARRPVDAVLDDFARLAGAEEAFLIRYRTQMNDRLQGWMSEGAATGPQTAGDHPREYRPSLLSFYRFAEAQQEEGDRYRTVTLPVPKPDGVPPVGAPSISAGTRATLVIEETSHQAFLRGKSLSVTPRVLRLLALLARRALEGEGGWVGRDVIYDALWPSSAGEPKVYDQQIGDTVRELRRAFDATEAGSGKRLIETKRGVGYRLSLSRSEITLL